MCAFKRDSDVIVAKCRTPALADVDAKVYTRNLLGSD
jgi:hypothetical protein